MWSALSFWWRLGRGPRWPGLPGLDCQAWIDDIARSVGCGDCRIFARENSVPGLDSFDSSRWRVKGQQDSISLSSTRHSNNCLTLAYIMDLKLSFASVQVKC